MRIYLLLALLFSTAAFAQHGLPHGDPSDRSDDPVRRDLTKPDERLAQAGAATVSGVPGPDRVPVEEQSFRRDSLVIRFESDPGGVSPSLRRDLPGVTR